jgi:integrase
VPLTVDRQLNAERLFAPVKTRKSRRIVPLPDMVVDVLRAHLVAFPPVTPDITHIDGSTVRGARLVFSRPNGSPLRQEVLRRAFYQARDAVGLSADVTFHVLRHTFASLMIAQGTSNRALQEWMGHGSITVTMNIYGHLFPDEHDRARAAMNAAFSD